jgi:hypothetical protein
MAMASTSVAQGHSPVPANLLACPDCARTFYHALGCPKALGSAVAPVEEPEAQPDFDDFPSGLAFPDDWAEGGAA